MMLDVAVRMLVHDRSKLAITVLGVAFSVALVLVQVGLFRGLLANATVTIEQADAEIWITSRNTPNIDFPHYFPDNYVQRVRSVPGVARADNLLVAYVAMQLPTGAEETVLVYGLESPTTWRLPWDVVEGKPEDLRSARRMFLDDSATRRCGPFAVGEAREMFGQRLEIAGRTRGALSFTTMPIAFTSLSVAQDLETGLFGGRTAYILVKLAPGADADEVAAELRRRLPYNDVHTREAWAQRTRDYWIVNTGLGFNMALTVLLGVIVGVTVVSQTLYAATLDHSREFGMLKAIGAENGHIQALIAAQAAVAAVTGFAFAIGPVFGLRELARGAGLELVLTSDLTLGVFAAAVVLCLSASLLSFRRIARIDPSLVFRT
jgi:putative ABC transport system permease protein